MFLMFSGSYYYPEGGWRDLVGVYNTLEEAKNEAHTKGEHWLHIVDAESLEIVSSGQLVKLSKGVYEYVEEENEQ